MVDFSEDRMVTTCFITGSQGVCPMVDFSEDRMVTTCFIMKYIELKVKSISCHVNDIHKHYITET